MNLYNYHEEIEAVYDQKVLALYTAAGRQVDTGTPIWLHRFSRDAVLYGYNYSSAKHLYELWVGLGSHGAPIPPPLYDMDVEPVNVQTTDPGKVTFYCTWWLMKRFAFSQDNLNYWYNTVMAVFEPTHTPGWTADNYWPTLISNGYPLPNFVE